MSKKNRFKEILFQQRLRKCRPIKWLDVTQTLHIDGKIVGRKSNRIYGIRSTGSAHTPRDLAIQMVWDKSITGNFPHRKWDIFNSISQKLPNATSEQIDTAWREVFMNEKEIIEKTFNEQNNTSSEWMKANDLLKMNSESLINRFSKSPMAVKYSFLYYFVKACYNFDYAEMQKDIEQNVPQAAKEWIDSPNNND